MLSTFAQAMLSRLSTDDLHAVCLESTQALRATGQLGAGLQLVGFYERRIAELVLKSVVFDEGLVVQLLVPPARPVWIRWPGTLHRFGGRRLAHVYFRLLDPQIDLLGFDCAEGGFSFWSPGVVVTPTDRPPKHVGGAPLAIDDEMREHRSRHEPGRAT